MATILIVDDQPDNLYVLGRLLKGRGYDVLQADNGSAALQIAAERTPDLILLDVMMPNMDGFEVVQRLRSDSITRTIPVVLLTANAPDERLKIQGLNLGADEYLTQPINNNELLARVEALLRTKQVQDALVSRNNQLQALLEIVRASTSTLDLSEVSHRLLDRTIDTLEMCAGSIWLKIDGDLLCLAQRGYSDGSIAERDVMPLAQSTTSMRVMEQRKPIFGSAEQIYGDLRTSVPGVVTLIVLPLVYRGRALGVLHLGIDRVYEFTPADLEFMGAVANAAATAVQNAQLYEEAERQRRQLEQIDHEKDEFISIIAHELKNPLASIKGYAGLLQRRARKEQLPAASVKGLDVIEQQANRMNLLLDQLRDVSQIGMDRFQIDPSVLDVSDLTQRLVAEMQATTSSHTINLTIEDDEPTLLARVDEFRMSQVLNNLLSNAVKYSPDGGSIDVTVRRVDSAPCDTEAGAGEWVTISVRDQGIGIPSDTQDRLFQRFYRAPNAKGMISGMGLGLYITREIVMRHGGCMWLESDEGKGSLFGVALPLVEQPSAGSATPSSVPSVSKAAK